MHLFQSGGFYIKTNPPLGRPILSPAPASPSRGGWFTPRLPPITHCSSPRVRGTRHEGCPGTAAPREPGAQRPRPRRLTFLMLAPGPSHMDFYNLTSPWPRAAGRSRSRRQSRSPSVQEREEEKEERGGDHTYRLKVRGLENIFIPCKCEAKETWSSNPHIRQNGP